MGTASDVNPYAMSRTEDTLALPEYSQIDPAYAVPDITEDAPYNDEFGWAPHLRLGAESTPDDARLGSRPLHEFYPDTRDPEEFYEKRDANKALRHAVEHVDGNGWNEDQGIAAGDRRWADNPRRNPPPNNRVTQTLAPLTYSYMRPFMTGLPKEGARHLNQAHFSMADHRRNYPDGEMGAVHTKRNTYRVDPTPWDIDLVDMPPQQMASIPNGRYQGVEVSPPSRSWRLG